MYMEVLISKKPKNCPVSVNNVSFFFPGRNSNIVVRYLYIAFSKTRLPSHLRRAGEAVSAF